MCSSSWLPCSYQTLEPVSNMGSQLTPGRSSQLVIVPQNSLRISESTDDDRGERLVMHVCIFPQKSLKSGHSHLVTKRNGKHLRGMSISIERCTLLILAKCFSGVLFPQYVCRGEKQQAAEAQIAYTKRRCVHSTRLLFLFLIVYQLSV